MKQSFLIFAGLLFTAPIATAQLFSMLFEKANYTDFFAR
jgi:hypothetical protein